MMLLKLCLELNLDLCESGNIRYIDKSNICIVLQTSLDQNQMIKFFAPFSCINRVIGRASL